MNRGKHNNPNSAKEKVRLIFLMLLIEFLMQSIP